MNDEIRLYEPVVHPDGMTEMTYHFPHAAGYSALIVTVDGKVKHRLPSNEFGMVRIKLPTGRISRVRFEAVRNAGSDWSSSSEVDITVPSNRLSGNAGGVVLTDEVATPVKYQAIGRGLRRPRGFASIGLHLPKTPANIGGAIRAAQNYGAASVAISGYRDGIRHGTNTMAGHRHMPIYRGELRDLIPFGAVPVAIELVDGAVPLFDFEHPAQAFYVFGPEDGTLGKAVLDWCPHKVMIPMQGCSNLAATVNVVLYDRAMKEATK